MSSTWSSKRRTIYTHLVLLAILSTLISPASCAETYTNDACRSQTSAMMACAKRWDSIRTECTKSVNTNTVWPGPCECAYYANDLPCFDEQALCADQVWTQVPQWFRDGVSSCLMKDASYTVRAQLGSANGSMGNPFTVSGLAGQLTRTTSLSSIAQTATPAVTGASASLATATGVLDPAPLRGMSTGAKAGLGVGIGVGVIVLLGIAAFLFIRHRRNTIALSDAEASRRSSPNELQEDHVQIHQILSKEVFPPSEMMGSLPPSYELGNEVSTKHLVELAEPKAELRG